MTGHTYEICLALGVLSPMIGFWLLVFGGRVLGKPGAGWFALVTGMGVPLVLATYVLLCWLRVDDATRAALTENAARFHWATIGGVSIDIGIKLDSLTIAMFFMVTFIAFWIFFFSIGYMSGHSDEVDGKRKYWRFFAYLSLFAFSMLGLVVSSNLLFLFIFWELVGLCSYLLIGFYFHEPTPQYAQIKAFVTNRVGDFGFLIGMMLVFFHLKTLDLDQAAVVFGEQYAAGSGIFASGFTMFGWSLATILGIGLFCGAMGKSAQFPLHVWLPDAMAGPTPVSALIHAATMVAAGVYLVARVFRLMTPEALMFVAAIGCITLTLMALIALVQVDIKKCLAYSTLSQLGYMIFGMGCGAWVAALFHLVTHAFFKAMLFLGSGQVIEGCHHVQDMRRMGGLRKKMPVTCWTFFIGVLAISGAGIAGVKVGGAGIGLGGFFSKDEILAVAYVRSHEWTSYERVEEGHGGGHGSDEHASAVKVGASRVILASDPAHGDSGHGSTAHGASAHGGSHATGKAAIFENTPPLPKWMFYLALATAYITPFYMMRAWWMTFMGKPRDQHVYDHAHETPMMYIPLAVLAGGTAFASYFVFRDLFAHAAPDATDAAMVLAIDGTTHTPAMSAAHSYLVYAVGGSFVAGFALAIGIYGRGLDVAEKIKRTAGPLHTLLEKKYFIDELYHLVWIKGCLVVATVARFFDTWVLDLAYNLLGSATERFAVFIGRFVDVHGVDGIVNGISKTSLDVSDVVRSPQTGRIRSYVMFAAMVAAVVILILVFKPEPSHRLLIPSVASLGG